MQLKQIDTQSARAHTLAVAIILANVDVVRDITKLSRECGRPENKRNWEKWQNEMISVRAGNMRRDENGQSHSTDRSVASDAIVFRVFAIAPPRSPDVHVQGSTLSHPQHAHTLVIVAAKNSCSCFQQTRTVKVFSTSIQIGTTKKRMQFPSNAKNGQACRRAPPWLPWLQSVNITSN